MVLDRLREARRREARDADWADVALSQRVDAREPATSATVEDDAIVREEIDRLAAAVATLPPGAARAFRLHKLYGLSHAETAAALGISRKGVEKHIATAMLHLRRRLNGDDVG